MAKQITCDCGFIIRGESDEELVGNAQQHAREAHDMELTGEQALAMAVEV